MSKQVEVTVLPNCDVCRMAQKTAVAYADAAVPATGSWGYLCREHFDLYGCQLGTGRGQELVLIGNSPETCDTCSKEPDTPAEYDAYEAHVKEAHQDLYKRYAELSTDPVWQGDPTYSPPGLYDFING